jgi:hypothetical protein
MHRTRNDRRSSHRAIERVNSDDTGWTVGYLRGMGGGDLLTGFELGDTARAAVRPLLDLATRYEANRRDG